MSSVAVSVKPVKPLSPASILRRLKARLEIFERRGHWFTLVASACWSWSAWIGSGLLAGWLDLLVDLPPVLRLVLLIAAWAAPFMVWMRCWGRSHAAHALPVLSKRLDDVSLRDGQITAGFDLSRAPMLEKSTTAEPLTKGMALMAVLRAADLISGIKPDRALPVATLRTSMGTAAGLALFVVILVLAMPRLVWTEVQRFYVPFGDHPPYSRLSFEVTPGDVQVLYGESLPIRVVVHGPNPERVELVLERSAVVGQESTSSAAGSEAAREILPMFPEGDGGWRTSLAQIVAPAKYSIRSGTARSRRYNIEVILVPEIESVQFQITPPAYTRRMPFEGTMPHDGLSGLPGTQVEVRARSNRPLFGGTITVFDEGGRSTVKMQRHADDPLLAVGTFPIRQNGRIEVHVLDTEQRQSREPFNAPVNLLVDQPPFVRLMEPREVSFATADAVLPVVIAAEDDYGLKRVELFRNLNNSSYRPQPIAVSDPPPMRTNDVVLLPLREYRLQPGDEIRLFARVTDNDPGLTASLPEIASREVSTTETDADMEPGKGAESAVAVVRIISRADFDRMQQTRQSLESLLSKYQQAERRVESLQEEIETLRKQLESDPADSPLSERREEELERLEKRLEEEAEALQKLTDSKLPFDLDKQLTPELQRLQKRVQQAAESLAKRPPGQSAAQAREQLEQLAQELKKNSGEFQEKTEPPLELLSQVFPLMENQARFTELYQRQRDLAERLRSLREQDNPDAPAVRARMRELEAEQRVLREDLAELTEQIRENAERLPEDERFNDLRQTALEFAEVLRKSGAAGKMGQAEQSLAEFTGSTGYERAQEAADILEQFLSKCSGTGQACKNCLPKFQPGLCDSLSQTMQELLAQMGLGDGPNSGFGTGSGNGYSTRRGTAQNVGLYGNQPMMDPSQSRMGHSPSQHGAGTRGRGADGSDGRSPREGGLSFRRQLTSGGAGELPVPARYRDRVGRYFQRLADELGER